MNTETWTFPLKDWSFQSIPEGDHNGAFGKVRKYDIHTGVDLYCEPNTEVFAVEDGEVIAIEEFTGPNADSPWWYDTQAVLVKGKSGVILYGEVTAPDIEVGLFLKRGMLFAFTKQVLKKDKGLPMCMLHFELYTSNIIESVWWKLNDTQPENLLNPTKKLQESLCSA